MAGHFEQRDRMAIGGGLHGGCQTGPAGADHGHTLAGQGSRQFVRSAIHSLRNGVNDVR